MPQFGLRGMKIAKYAVSNGAVVYSELQTVGAAMQANIELRRAEARLYADDGLAEVPVVGVLDLFQDGHVAA